jgi:FixJ family two-component response regulator
VKGKRQPLPDPSRSVTITDLNNRILALNEGLKRLQSASDRVSDLVRTSAKTTPSMDRALAGFQEEMSRIYGSMVRVRWAVLDLQSPFALAEVAEEGDPNGKGTPVPAETATVFVVDDNPSVRKALSRLFRSLNYSVEVFPSATQFLKVQPDAEPACVVLDVRMPRMSGLDLQKELADAGSDLPIVFITGHGDIDMAVKAIKDGAVDFLPKPVDDQDLIDSVDRALAYHADLREENRGKDLLEERRKRISPREHEVFERVVKGMLNKQIGFELGTTEKTIKVHRGRVMEKMEAESLADLVRMAQRLGIEGPPNVEEE